MSWFKFDDNAVDHPKVSCLTDKAFRWWVRGLSYASRYLTDGLLPKVFWKQAPNGVRTELVSVRLWDWIDPDFMIHDYAKHQSLKEDVEADKERNRHNSKAYRDRRRAERRQSVSTNVSADASADRQQPVIAESAPQRTDNRLQITENREQTVAAPPPPAPAKPIISGQANPRDWGRIHGNHETGFCDWVCLPDFVFEEFRGKSGQTAVADQGRAYVRGWALKVRSEWGNRPIGEDGLKFWRARWSESHATKPAGHAPIRIQDILDKEAAKKAAQR